MTDKEKPTTQLPPRIEEQKPIRTWAENIRISLIRAAEWIAERGPSIVLLRIYAQIARRITGAPILRYSEITPQLHVGGQPYARGMDSLHQRGITAIVNMRKYHDDRKSGVVMPNYLHLRIADNTAPSQAQLHEGVAFINQQIETGGKVYVHCGVGVGRAPTMVAAYLVSTGMTPEAAWETIRETRPFIWPNRHQRASVEEFAR